MRFPEFLYLLSGRDQQVTWLDPLIQRVASTVATGVLAAELLLPEARVLVLTHAHCHGDPGAAQFITMQRIFLQSPAPALVEHHLKRSDVALAADVNGNLDWQGEILVLPGWRILVENTFNAAVAANTTIGSFVGVSIPIGNIARV